MGVSVPEGVVLKCVDYKDYAERKGNTETMALNGCEDYALISGQFNALDLMKYG